LDIQQQQITAQAQQSAAMLAEQQREFGIQQDQNTKALANTAALQAKQQAAVDQQAALTKTWQTGRAQAQADATGTIDDAFGQFTPEYYKNFTKAYQDNYDPQIQRQADVANNNTTFGLARTGNLQSQTAADQWGNVATTKGLAETDVNNRAIAATTAQENAVANAKANLTSKATSDATLGSPITPGSADAISANFNNTSAALQAIRATAGDATTTLAATPTYSSLGSLFGGLATAGTSAVQGNNYYNNAMAYQNGFTGGAASPSTSSGVVK
jgi:hypothetical protein